MSTLSTTHRYRIVVLDECAALLESLLKGSTIDSGTGWTSIVASVRDEAELYGLLDRLQELALHIVSLQDLDRAPHGAGLPGERR